MDIAEAERIMEAVQDILLNNGARQAGAQALQGYELLDVIAAVKLRVANELQYLIATKREHLFRSGLDLYDTASSHLSLAVMADDTLKLDPSFRYLDSDNKITDPRVAESETVGSFGAHCLIIEDEPDYWKRVYYRIGLAYRQTSPQGREYIPT